MRNGSSAFEFSNCLTIFGTTNVSSIATIETQTTNSSTGYSIAVSVRLRSCSRLSV